YILQAMPEIEDIERLANDSTEERNSLDPVKAEGQARIGGNEKGGDGGIILPIAHQKIGLHGLASNIPQARRNQSNSDARVLREPRSRLAKSRAPLFPVQHPGIEVAILRANVFATEICSRELPGPAGN